MYVHVPGYAAILFRRTYADLALPGALMDRSHAWLDSTDAKWSNEKKTWTFPSGASITFGYLERDSDVYRYQSAEFQFVGFDELTQFNEYQYTYLFSRLRRTEELGKVPLRMRGASNPGGIGHQWVKNRFITKREPGVVFIPATLNDAESYLDTTAYRESLSKLPEELQKQLLEGDWSAFEGAAFPEFNRKLHGVPIVPLEDQWERFESMDYGISNPTAWLAWAVDFEGNLIVYDRFYKPSLPSETAPEILRKRREWGSRNCWGDPNSLAMRTSTVNKFGEPATIETEFSDLGVPVMRGNDNPKAGYTRLRELLKPDPTRRFPDWHPFRGKPGSPRLFIVVDRVPELIEQLESATVQPIDKRDGGEKVDPDWEGRYGHAVAAARYGAMSRPDASDYVESIDLDPRAAFIEDQLRKRSGSSTTPRSIRWEIA